MCVTTTPAPIAVTVDPPYSFLMQITDSSQPRERRRGETLERASSSGWVNNGGSARRTGSFYGLTLTPAGESLTYHWYKDSDPDPLSNQTSSTLTLTGVSAANAGLYHARVTNRSGSSLDSAEARLHVNSTPYNAPVVSEYNDGFPGYPQLGQPAIFDASMDISPSPAPVWYQWRKNGVPIPGQFGPCTLNPVDGTYNAGTYTIAQVDCPDTASYSVVFTNRYWKVASAAAAITVADESSQSVPPVLFNWQTPPNWQAPVVTITIADKTHPPELSVRACFNAVCWQWYHADSYGSPTEPILDATGPSYTFPSGPNGVTCSFLGSRCFLVRVFDEGHIPYDCRFIVSGDSDCQP